jgi:beta-adrenergic-receptor kinase
MGEDGRTKLSDLGLACKVGRSGLSGTCGTRGYWAPEMLRKDANGKRERYHLSVDWFSLGCCIYEFIYGISPFRTERARQWGDFPKADKADKDKAIDLAIKEMEPEFDSSFDNDLKDLIQKLLIKDGKTRLGAQGAQQIMNHPWFSTIDWANIDYTPPPTVPSKDINMATQSEIGTFSDEKSFKKVDLTDEDHKVYEKWDFISLKSFQDEITEFLIYEDVFVSIS